MQNLKATNTWLPTIATTILQNLQAQIPGHTWQRWHGGNRGPPNRHRPDSPSAPAPKTLTSCRSPPDKAQLAGFTQFLDGKKSPAKKWKAGCNGLRKELIPTVYSCLKVRGKKCGLKLPLSIQVSEGRSAAGSAKRCGTRCCDPSYERCRPLGR